MGKHRAALLDSGEPFEIDIIVLGKQPEAGKKIADFVNPVRSFLLLLE
tara:strand:- start:14714 stop:14857 length:144 start_codon:yes stop_codon:yes gene_type:complete